MRATTVAVLAAWAALSGVCLAQRSGQREVGIVETSTATLEEITGIPEKSIPPQLLLDAQAIAVLPGVVKAGFVVGGRHGRGVVSVRTANGGWSLPIFLELSGGGIGWQAGVQSTDLVLVFRTKKGLERLIQGKDKFTLGAAASIAAGPVGRALTAETDPKLRAEILSYSRSRGLFAGVSLEGAVLHVHDKANAAFYGRAIGPREIVEANGATVPAAIVKFTELLGRLAPPPAPPASLGPPVVVTPLPPPTVVVPPPPPPKQR